MSRGAEAVAREVGEICPHCKRLKSWKIVRHPFDEGRLFSYPLPCDCDGAKAAERAEATKEAQIEKRLRETARKNAIARAGLVGFLADCSFDSFERRKEWPGALDIAIRVRKYWDAVYAGQYGSKPWLLLCGEYGTGKTHLAASVIREAVLAGWGDVYFRPWTEYLRRIQASWDRMSGEQRTSDIIAELQKGKLVVIDDIDKKEPRSGWSREEIYPVLNYRYNAELPTILTFNCVPTKPDPDAPGRMLLERYVGAAILDRIMGASFAIINFDGPSYRSGVKW